MSTSRAAPLARLRPARETDAPPPARSFSTRATRSATSWWRGDRSSPAVVAAKKELRTLADDPNTVDLYIGANGGFYASTRRAIKEAKRRLFHSRHKEHRRSGVPFSFTLPMLRTPPEGRRRRRTTTTTRTTTTMTAATRRSGGRTRSRGSADHAGEAQEVRVHGDGRGGDHHLGVARAPDKASCDPIASLAPSSQLTSPSLEQVQQDPKSSAVVRRAGALRAREDADAVMLRRLSARVAAGGVAASGRRERER